MFPQQSGSASTHSGDHAAAPPASRSLPKHERSELLEMIATFSYKLGSSILVEAATAYPDVSERIATYHEDLDPWEKHVASEDEDEEEEAEEQEEEVEEEEEEDDEKEEQDPSRDTPPSPSTATPGRRTSSSTTTPTALD